MMSEAISSSLIYLFNSHTIWSTEQKIFGENLIMKCRENIRKALNEDKGNSDIFSYKFLSASSVMGTDVRENNLN